VGRGGRGGATGGRVSWPAGRAPPTPAAIRRQPYPRGLLATLALDPAAVLQARFATSPVWEAAAATRVLAQGAHTFHGTWVAQTRAALRRTATALPTLDLLVPPSGHIADRSEERRVERVQVD